MRNGDHKECKQQIVRRQLQLEQYNMIIGNLIKTHVNLNNY